MAIQPVELFQQQPGTSLVQILQGGNTQLSRILDSAIQIGRDVANKRTQQEQDMLAMRQQETNLAQRRAADLQQNIEDAQKFAFTRSDTDRKFDAAMQQQGWSQERTGIQDLFSNEQTALRTGLAQQEGARQDQELGMRQDAVAQEQAQRQAVSDYAMEGTKPQGLVDRVKTGISSLFNTGNVGEQALVAKKNEADMKAKAAVASKNLPAAAKWSAEAELADRELARKYPTRTTTSRVSTVSPEMQAAKEELTMLQVQKLRGELKKDVAGKAFSVLENNIKLNQDAFPLEADKLTALAAKDKDGTIKADEKIQLNKLMEWNKDPLGSEYRTIVTLLDVPNGRATYISRGPAGATKAQAAARGKAFDQAKAIYDQLEGTETEAGPQVLPPPPAKSAVDMIPGI